MTTAAIVTTIVLSLICVVGAVVAWTTRRSPRGVVRGVGLALVPVGLLLLGWMDLLINGFFSLVDWAQRTVWVQTMTTGAVIAAIGVLLVLGSSFLRAGQPVTRKPVEQAPGTKTPQVTSGRSTSAKAASPRPAEKKAGQPGLDAEDLEIEALLKKRGIE